MKLNMFDKKFWCRMAFAAVCLIVLGQGTLTAAGMASILIQPSPPNGGTVSPGIGIQNVENGSQMTLRAFPKPGYHFVYWLGDVENSTSITTRAQADSPKIIIAIFERVQQEFSIYEDIINYPTGGPMHFNAADVGGGGAVSGADGRRPKSRGFAMPPQEQQDDFPVPETEDDFPVPQVPEPATLMLFGLGGLFMIFKRHTAIVKV